MRIDRLHIENFKKFAVQDFDFHPKFTLLAGDNGAGKTTVLDALAVAAGVWLVEAPDSTLSNSGRIILPTEIRLEPEGRGDRVLFNERRPVVVKATGQIGDHEAVVWARQIRKDGKRTSNVEAKQALEYVNDIYSRDGTGERVLCPVLAYYGAGRAWLPSNERIPKEAKSNGPARRWAAFYDCFNERIRFPELQKWFLGETIASINRGGRFRPGFEAVKRAILRCLPGASKVWYDTDLEQIVLTLDGNSQPFGNLSAGQRMMLALLANLAIKAVTQNAFLLPPDKLGPDDEPLPRVLRETPGVVLIDELDVHLHPKWQRRVATDLKETFPGIQFICTSHSPQVIGEVKPEEVRMLEGGEVTTPTRTFGIDSDRVLNELMDATARNKQVEEKLRDLAAAIDREDFSQSEQLLKEVENILGETDPEVTHYRTLISFLRETK